MRPEYAFFPEKAMLFHIHAPVHLLILNPLNQLLSLPHCPSTLMQHTSAWDIFSWQTGQIWSTKSSVHFCQFFYQIPPTLCLLPKQWVDNGVYDILLGNITGDLLMKGMISVSPCVLLNPHMYCAVYSYIISGKNEQLSWWIGKSWVKIKKTAYIHEKCARVNKSTETLT